MLKLESGRYFEYEFIGEFKTDSEWIHSKRTIRSYELIFVIDGMVYIEEDGIRYEIGKNQMIILEPGKVHLGYRTSLPPVSFYWFHFYTDMPLPFKTYSENEYFDTKYLLKKLLHMTNSPVYTPESTDAAGLLIYEELAVLSRTEGINKSTLCERIAEYIRINLSEGITVSGIASHFGYNTDYIGKIFKKGFGVGLKKYIALEKINLAKDLLQSTDLSVKQISSHAGFEDENLFVKFFMYHEEISPTQFRKKYYMTHLNRI